MRDRKEKLAAGGCLLKPMHSKRTLRVIGSSYEYVERISTENVLLLCVCD